MAEGLRLAAEDRYGLAATVLTGDTATALQAAAELPVGTVKINAVFGGAPGGSAEPRGASGSGFGYGPHLLDEMTTTTVVHLEAAPRRATATAAGQQRRRPGDRRQPRHRHRDRRGRPMTADVRMVRRVVDAVAAAEPVVVVVGDVHPRPLDGRRGRTGLP